MDEPRRIATLDGARGLAALAVMCLHFTFERFPPNAVLAVDLFFMLSGYVLAATYEGRLRAGMTAAEFIGARLTRLYPVYLLACGGGLLVALHDGNPQALQVFFANAVFAPFLGDASYHGRIWLNSPLWSLSFEMAVNLAFAVGLWRLPTRWLVHRTVEPVGRQVAQRVRGLRLWWTGTAPVPVAEGLDQPWRPRP